MGSSVHCLIPVVSALKKLGSDVSDARRRRRIPMALLAERAGLSRSTLSKIERGDPGTSMGCYASVLFSLGMIDRVRDMVDGMTDVLGRSLEDEKLPKRVRLSKRR